MFPTSPRRGSLFGIFLCFFFSGAAGLIYQVAWGKALGLIFGHTVYAIATVLAVFMAGLAVGSAYLGSWNEQHARPIALYGWVELAVAATGALSLVGLGGVRSMYVAAYPMIGSAPPLLLFVRFFGAAVVLFLPTFLMGGTLPILVRGLTRREGELAASISRLYWVNTLGAVAGTLAAGFLLVPTIGLRRTIACAVILNVAAGLVALRISGPAVAADTAAESTANLAAPPAATEGHLTSTARGFLFFAFGVVGATAIAYEIAWTRLLATILGSSTYAFTLMLATFLAGIVIGSMIFEAWFARAKQVSLANFARTQTWTGFAALVFLALFQRIPAAVPPILRLTHESFGGLVFAQFVTSALAMLPAAIIFGFNFPAVAVLLAGIVRSGPSHSATVGRAYAANTIGAIVGAAATGFWLIPTLGSFRVVGLIAGINLVLAIALELYCKPPGRLALAANAVALFLVAVCTLSPLFYNRALASFSTVLYWKIKQGKQLSLAETASTYDFPFVADGLNASIAVIRTENYIALTTNGKVDASDHDASTQILVGHLGAVFDPAPRRVLIIGFGSGMTVSAVARHPEVQRIDCVEIEPAVIQAAPYLRKLNRDVLSDPRVHIVLDDARNFLLTSPDQYDLIISEPSNPWIAGIASLFTQEYYVAVRRHLSAGGKFVQWIQGYTLDPADLRMIVATLSKHFPETTLWRAMSGDFLAFARTDTQPLRFDRMRSLWQNASLREDFAALQLHHPEGLVAYFVLNDTGVRRLAAGGEVNTDDRTLLEYHAPRAMLNLDLAARNNRVVVGFREGLLPSNLDPSETSRALKAGVETYLEMGDRFAVAAYLKVLEQEPPTADLEIVRGRVQLAANHLDEATTHFETAVRLNPDSLAALHWLAVIAHIKKDDVSAERDLERIFQRDPKFPPALADRVQFAADRQDWYAAAVAQSEFLPATQNPLALEYCRLGEFWLRAQHVGEAEKAFLTGSVQDPYSYCCNRSLGDLYRQAGYMDRARRYLDVVVQFFPDADPGTFSSLASVDRALGDRRAAEQALRKGRRIFPNEQTLRQP